MSGSSDKKKLGLAVTIPLMVMLIARFLVPAFAEARKQAQRNACIANLKQIDSACIGWGLENKKSWDDVVDVRAVTSYLKGGVLPDCPAGGKYTVNPTIGQLPNCSVPGHDLSDGRPSPALTGPMTNDFLIPKSLRNQQEPSN